MNDPCETKGLEVLREELAYYESRKSDLLLSHENQFVLIKGQKVVGFYATEEAAYSDGIQKLGNTPFLIKQVLKVDPPQVIPALYFGLIRANA